jgi:lipoyl(octanoyl) transferase
LGIQDYLPCWEAMRTFTNQRNAHTPDEIWLLEHPPVFTQGQNGKPEHVLEPGMIPIIKVDRGGQVTYHGPGQLIVYPLINIQRRNINIRQLVTLLENTTIELLKHYQIQGLTQLKAPGVYVNQKKIASIGLRIRRGCSYHGLAFNLTMDLEPFSRIHPCGFPELKMTQLTEWVKKPVILKEIGLELAHCLIKNMENSHATENTQSS